MARSVLTGTRIRERRTLLGIKQYDLARTVDISPSYLNLIEHNRRRIGGKLLSAIASALQADVSALTQGAEAELLDQLNQAASSMCDVDTESDQIDELVGRFPGWAGLIRAQHVMIGDLQERLEELGDRLNHDPRLSGAMHDLLSKAASIQSASTILVETEDLDDAWRTRFHRNLHGDSVLLAESAQDLLSFLKLSESETEDVTSPWRQVEQFFEAHRFHFPAIEANGADAISDLLNEAVSLSDTARNLVEGQLAQYARDAAVLPLDVVSAHLEAPLPDPAVLATDAQVSLATALRRMAMVPTPLRQDPIGFVLADGTGNLLMSKATNGFLVPRSGRACPLWPLYEAMMTPSRPVQRIVQHSAGMGARVRTYGYAEAHWPMGTDGPSLVSAWMLVQAMPDTHMAHDAPVLPVGSACRVCMQEACVARQEPSVLANSFDTPRERPDT